jgi:hypothetical protein
VTDREVALTHLEQAKFNLDKAYLNMLQAGTAAHLMSPFTAYQCGIALAALRLAQERLSADIEKAKATSDVPISTAS